MRPLTQSPRSGGLGPPLQFCRTCLLRASPAPATQRPAWHSGLDDQAGGGSGGVGRRRAYATDAPSTVTPGTAAQPPSPFMSPPPAPAAKRPRSSARTADGSSGGSGAAKRGGGRKTPSKSSGAQAAAAGQTQLRLWRETLDVLRKLETAQGRLAEQAQAGIGSSSGGSSSNKKTGSSPSSSKSATGGGDASRTVAGPSSKKKGVAAAAAVVAEAAAGGGPGKSSSPDQVKMLTSALHLLKTVLSTQAPPEPQQQQQQHKKQKQGGGENTKAADGGNTKAGKTTKKKPQKKKSDVATDVMATAAATAAATTAAAASTKSKTKKKTGDTATATAAAAGGDGPRTKPFAYVTQPLKSPFRVSKVNARNLALTPVEEAERRPVPRLHYGLDRALFNPGVYHLQDPRSRVYNFDPYLATIMPLREFDFNALKQYVTSSKDATLGAMAARHQKRYAGSTSSMTSMLSHFHFLLSGWRPINPAHTSRAFTPESLNFTRITKAPAATFLHWRPADGTYAIDADKEFDTANILSMLGKSMEKLLTLSRADFEKYRVTKSHELTDAERNDPEAYHYTTFGDFLMRSQLDAHDARLPGTGMFDLKTRAVVSIRMDAQAFQRGLGYEIRHRIGQWESFEREYFDMIRSAFLKYSLQVRMGRMDGIYVAFHNTRRIFGFQYISIHEMDLALHGPGAVADDDLAAGNSGGVLGDREFLLSLHLLNAVLDRATERFPGRSLRLHIETRPSEAAPFMYIFAKPVDAAEIEEVQNASKESVEAFENEILGIVPAAAKAASPNSADADRKEEDDDDDDREAAAARAAAANEADLDADFESDADDDGESLDVWESMRQKVEETMENEAQGLESVRDTIEDALEQSGLLHGRSPDETRAYVRALLEAVTDATDTATVAERILNDEGADAAAAAADEPSVVIEEEGDDAEEVEDVEAEEAEDAAAAAAAAESAAEADTDVEDAAAGDAVEEPEDARADRDTESASATSADEADETDEAEDAHSPSPVAAAPAPESSSSSSSSSPSSSDTISLKDLIIKLAAQVEASQARETTTTTTTAAPAGPTTTAVVAGSEEEPEDKDAGPASSELVDAPKNKRFERILSEMMASAVREKRKGGEAEATAEAEAASEAEATSEAASGEEAETKASSTTAEGAATAAAADEEELLGMILTIRNKVNGRYVVRPERLARSDSWTVEYAIEEIRPARRAQSLYELLKKRRKTLLSPRAAAEANGNGNGNGNGSGSGKSSGSSGKASFDREYMARLHAMSARGRRFRKLEDERARGRPVQVYGEDEPQSWEAVLLSFLISSFSFPIPSFSSRISRYLYTPLSGQHPTMALPPSLETLPGEILLLILTYLHPRDIARLQRTSKALCRAGRDAGFWRLMAYDDSRYLRIFERRKRFGGGGAVTTTTATTTTAAARPAVRAAPALAPGDAADEAARARARKAEKTRILANWDPVYPGEAVSWYDEYVQRYGPIAVNWFEVPRRLGDGDGGADDPTADAVDVLGVALYRPPAAGTDARPALLAVAPLQDGSVCLWDVTGSTAGRPGAIVQRSGPGLLPGVAADDDALLLGADDCVSVDSRRGIGYFSVWNRLIEIDLQTLSVVTVVDYPSTLTALSSGYLSTPLTVGMANGIHTHDARAPQAAAGPASAFRSVDEIVASRVEQVDMAACGTHPAPGPLAILHLPAAGSSDVASHDVYTAGRFPSILHYDMRNLSAVQDAIHSGASLAGLASLPYPFSARDAEMRRHGTMSVAQVEASKALADGRTLLACGDYKAKGSLELYDIGSGVSKAAAAAAAAAAAPSDSALSPAAAYEANGAMKNRHTTSPSRLVSVAAHGARIVVSDTLGYVRWFERDGFTEVRQKDLNAEVAAASSSSSAAARPEQDVEMQDGVDTAHDNSVFARKLLPTQQPGSCSDAADDGLVFWTGDRLGLLTFTGRPRFRASDFEAAGKMAEERAADREGSQYRATMRQFFHDVRMAGEFGL